MRESIIEGENPVSHVSIPVLNAVSESRSLEVERKMGGSLHLKLIKHSRPIANKYREGKMKRTLERGLKVPEIAEREADKVSC